MNEKRFTIEFDGHQYFLVIDEDNERCLARLDTMQDAHAWLEIYEMLSDENKELKEQNQSIKKTINELHDAIKFDIDNGFEVYPKLLVEYLMNTLKVIGDLE